MNVEDTDRLLAYRSLLAAEDHLAEIMNATGSIEAMENLRAIEYIRSNVMPEEKDKTYHCVVKHLSLAYEALREVRKETNSDRDRENEMAIYSILMYFVERLWGRKVVTCERCGQKEEHESNRIQGETGENTSGSIDDGLTGDLIQGVSGDRESSVSGGEASSNG